MGKKNKGKKKSAQKMESVGNASVNTSEASEAVNDPKENGGVSPSDSVINGETKKWADASASIDDSDKPPVSEGNGAPSSAPASNNVNRESTHPDSPVLANEIDDTTHIGEVLSFSDESPSSAAVEESETKKTTEVKEPADRSIKQPQVENEDTQNVEIQTVPVAPAAEENATPVDMKETNNTKNATDNPSLLVKTAALEEETAVKGNGPMKTSEVNEPFDESGVEALTEEKDTQIEEIQTTQVTLMAEKSVTAEDGKDSNNSKNEVDNLSAMEENEPADESSKQSMMKDKDTLTTQMTPVVEENLGSGETKASKSTNDYKSPSSTGEAFAEKTVSTKTSEVKESVGKNEIQSSLVADDKTQGAQSMAGPGKDTVSANTVNARKSRSNIGAAYTEETPMKSYMSIFRKALYRCSCSKSPEDD